MKTLFVFNLIAFALVLVPVQTEEHRIKYRGTGCKLTQSGIDYAGPLSVTKSGRKCQRWDSDKPHANGYWNSTNFPEGSAKAAGNKCRNPDGYSEGVWCYTMDPIVLSELCDVKLCVASEGCKLTKTGVDYFGPLSVTVSGRTCQPWNSSKPHDHDHKTSKHFPEGSAEAAGNKCRNPDGFPEGVWCFTTDPQKRWELCDVRLCGAGQDCKVTPSGVDYSGPLNVTIGGRKCQRWNSNKPHSNPYKTSKFFPEWSADAADNKCRNPDDSPEGPWCYTTDPKKKRELCAVKLCASNNGCKRTKSGVEYAGPLNVTISGRTCQPWNSSKPHYNEYKNSELFPDGSADAAGNKCRNPNSNDEGPWCYTTDPLKRREDCDVKLCGAGQGCKVTKSGIDYAGPVSVTKYGRTCQRWNSDNPHVHGYKNSTNFPEGSAEAAGNKCRNPNGAPNGPWCYTTDPLMDWGYCDVKLCARPTCPPDFTYLPGSASCYKAVYEGHDWTSAGKLCQNFHRGSHLVAIETKPEDDALKMFFASEYAENVGWTQCTPHGTDALFWTSGRRLIDDCNSKFQWKFSSDQPFNFTNWLPGEPNCYMNIMEPCLNIRTVPNYGWNDLPCEYKICPLCEYTPEPQ